MYKIKDTILFILITITGVVSVIVSAFLCANCMCLFGIENSMFGKVLLTWISMLIGFCIIPTYILKKIYMVNRLELGIGKISKNEKRVVVLIVGMTVFYFMTQRNICSITVLGLFPLKEKELLNVNRH